MMQIVWRFLIFISLVSGCVANSEKQTQSRISVPTKNILASDNPCLNLLRLLNPSANPQTSETELDRNFRLAFDAETYGDFDKSFNYYKQASILAKCNCDKQHALAGMQAAHEVKILQKQKGDISKPTQFFWVRLQELTKDLPCIHR